MKDKYKKKKKPASYKVRRSKVYFGWAVVKNGEELKVFSTEILAEAYKSQLIKKERVGYK